MPPHREHSPARQERNKKLMIAYIAFNMTQDDDEEDPVLLALMAWATRKTRVRRMKQLWTWRVDSSVEYSVFAAKFLAVLFLAVPDISSDSTGDRC
ncbi:hypothetical protein M422DRAFT_252775 [Sphaerobolus stellatus SS14]|uniref:Uncharacterized protein n=1 Tax=Sphaerobolus stellatus (strain SS14) TaxID=990650 RepID=A0A0C9VA67_SPHS4|nr:hypothetical protein M422DRAFT_252775 [Sphaerobolus stellatus SS14]